MKGIRTRTKGWMMGIWAEGHHPFYIKISSTIPILFNPK